MTPEVAQLALAEELVAAAPDAVVVVDAHGTIVMANPAVETLLGYAPGALVGRPLEMLVPDSLRAAHRRHRQGFMDAPRGRPMGAGLRLTGRRSDGTELPIDVSLAPIATAAGTRLVGAFVRDATERDRAERRLRAIAELNQALLAGRPMEEVLGLTASSARRLVNASRAWVVRSGTDSDVVVVAADGEGADALLGARFRAAATVAGRVMAEGRALVTDDLSSSPQATEQARRLGLGPSLVVPMTHQDRHFGTIIVTRQGGEPPFRQQDLPVVEVFAAAAAIAFTMADTRGELERLSIVEDHDRIARDLHDTVIQRLFAVGMGLQAVQRLTEDPVQTRLAEAVEELDDTIRDIRTTIFRLHQSRAAGSGLRDAVGEVLADATSGLGFAPRVRFDGPVDVLVGEDVEEHLVAVLREALSNVARHARARAVDVVIAAGGGQLRLTVADDGTGLPDTPSAGHGLGNMAQRAELLGGRAELRRRQPHGTVVEWRVPLRDR